MFYILWGLFLWRTLTATHRADTDSIRNTGLTQEGTTKPCEYRTTFSLTAFASHKQLPCGSLTYKGRNKDPATEKGEEPSRRRSPRNSRRFLRGAPGWQALGARSWPRAPCPVPSESLGLDLGLRESPVSGTHTPTRCQPKEMQTKSRKSTLSARKIIPTSDFQIQWLVHHHT